ncbi:MAG: hypothetical protein WC462_03070 [archaeon]
MFLPKGIHKIFFPQVELSVAKDSPQRIEKQVLIQEELLFLP